MPGRRGYWYGLLDLPDRCDSLCPPLEMIGATDFLASQSRVSAAWLLARGDVVPTPNFASSVANLLRPSRWPLGATAVARSGRVELCAIPPLLRAADVGFVDEWRAGSFALAGHSVALVDGSPFSVGYAPAPWWAALHGFEWLRNIPHAADKKTVDDVHGLVAEWLARNSSHRNDRSATGVTIVARRVLSWLAHADLLLQTSDARFYDLVLGALMADVNVLERHWHALEPAGDRVRALIALAQAGLCIVDAEALQMQAEVALQSAFNGRHGSDLGFALALMRAPDTLADVLLDLEVLRLLYGMRFLAVPTVVSQAKAQMTETLSNLLLGDGRLARLGTPRDAGDARLTLASVTRNAGLAASGSCHNEAGGFARLVAGETVVMADVGAPFKSADALGLEVSSGDAALLVHDGCRRDDTVDDRVTCEHGALLFTTPASFPSLPKSIHFGATMPTLDATHSVAVDITNLARLSIDATHAGHARRGFVHRRRVALSRDGRQLEGIDELRPLVGGAGQADAPFAVRLVLHPAVVVMLGANPDRFELILSNTHRWRFEAAGHVVSLEGAMFRDGLETTQTLQILILSDAGGRRTVTWQLTRLDATG